MMITDFLKELCRCCTLARAIEDPFSAKIPAALAYSGARACKTEHKDHLKLHIVGQHYLAMATPGCIKLNKDKLVCVQRLLEVLLCEYKHPLVLGDFTKDRSKEEKTCQKSHLGLCKKFFVAINVSGEAAHKSFYEQCLSAGMYTRLYHSQLSKNMYGNPKESLGSELLHPWTWISQIQGLKSTYMSSC